MENFERNVAVLTALLALAFDVWAFKSRCPASPEVNVSILFFGLIIQAIAVALPLVRVAWFDSASDRQGLKVVGCAIILFVWSVLAVRYSVLYSDAIGKPNYFRSAGLACRVAG